MTHRTRKYAKSAAILRPCAVAAMNKKKELTLCQLQEYLADPQSRLGPKKARSGGLQNSRPSCLNGSSQAAYRRATPGTDRSQTYCSDCLRLWLGHTGLLCMSVAKDLSPMRTMYTMIRALGHHSCTVGGSPQRAEIRNSPVFGSSYQSSYQKSVAVVH